MVSQPGFWDFARSLDALSANADPLERVATSRPRPQAPTEPNQVDTSGNWQREAFGDSICVTVARG